MPDSTERPPHSPVQIALRILLGVATVGCAAAAGWMDLHGASLETTLLFVAGASFVLAAVVRGWGALGGMFIGLGVPLAQLYARAAGLHPDFAAGHIGRGYWAIVAAVSGMAVGLAARTGVEQARR